MHTDNGGGMVGVYPDPMYQNPVADRVFLIRYLQSVLFRYPWSKFFFVQIMQILHAFLQEMLASNVSSLSLSIGVLEHKNINHMN